MTQQADAIVVRDARSGAIARNDIGIVHYLRRTVRISYRCEGSEDGDGCSRVGVPERKVRHQSLPEIKKGASTANPRLSSSLDFTPPLLL